MRITIMKIEYGRKKRVFGISDGSIKVAYMIKINTQNK